MKNILIATLLLSTIGCAEIRDIFAGTSQHNFYVSNTKFVVTRFTDDTAHTVCYFVVPDTIQPYPVSISCVAPR